ncbi:helix-turn-helix domain-containing protein [Patescibacteria group bacterium]
MDTLLTDSYQNKLLTLKEVSEFLSCHPNTLRQWDKKGILPAYRIGEKRVRRYLMSDIIDFIRK